MKKSGILNSEISKVLADLGHTDQIIIADCGLPVPDNVQKIDIALKFDTPSFIETLESVLDDMEIEKVILADEIKTDNEKVENEVFNLVGENVAYEYIPHEEFKKMAKNVRAIIRTGERTPFANIILQSNVIF